jgi:hypothetical protein
VSGGDGAVTRMERSGVRYRTIVADPPWHYPHGHPAREHKKHPYSTMTIGELCELPVGDWADCLDWDESCTVCAPRQSAPKGATSGLAVPPCSPASGDQPKGAVSSEDT